MNIFKNITFLLLTASCVTCFAKQRKPSQSAGYSYFDTAKKEIESILSSKSFQGEFVGENKSREKISDYTITNIRQGEIGESQAYFVRLAKPFSASTKDYCIVLFSAEKVQTDFHLCAEGE